MPIAERFGTLREANVFREQFEEHLSEEDKRNERTVRIVEDAPEDVVDELHIKGQASQTKQADAAQVAQPRDLSDAEWEWAKSRGATPQDRFTLQHVKGAFAAEGVPDWTNHADVGMEKSEAREVARNIRQSEGRFGGIDPSVARDITEEEQRFSGARQANRAIRERRKQLTTRMQDLLEEHGVEQVAAAMGGFENQVPADLFETVQDMLDAFPEAREIMEGQIRNEVGAVFETIEADVEMVDPGRIEALQREAEARDISEETLERVVGRLEVAFGMRFDSFEDAIDRLQDRLSRQAGPAVKSAEITARMTSGGPSIRVESDDRDILTFQDNVRRAARRRLDLSALGSVRQTLGQIRIEDGELAEINLESGRDQLGAPDVAESESGSVPGPVVSPAPEETEQAELPAPETSAEVVASALIDALSRSRGSGGAG